MARSNTKTKTRTEVALAMPGRYRVILHNDDVTPMQFVIQLLIEVFNKNIKEAESVMLAVHNNGKAVAGIYSYEIAEQKVSEVTVISNYEGHPFKATMELL